MEMNSTPKPLAKAINITLLSLFSCAPFTFATAEDNATHLDALVVTATRTPQTIDETLAPVTVITQEDIERSGATDTVDLLRGRAGINFASNGGPGKTSSIFMRGTNSDHVLVLVDGIRIGSATLGSIPFQHIPASQIERIEIVRGPRSAIYGSNAIGGVIQIFTKRPTGEPQATLSFEYGSYDTQKTSLGIAGKKQALEYQLHLAHHKTDGFDVRPDSTDPDDDGYENLSVTGKLSGSITESTRVIFNWLRAEGDNKYDDNAEADSVQQILSLSFDTEINDRWDSRIILGNSQDLSTRYGSFSGRTDTKRNLFSWENNFFIDDENVLTAGIDYQDDRVDSTTNYAVTERDEKAVFAEYQTALGNHDGFFALRHTDNEQFGTHNTGNVEWGYALTEGLRITVGYGEAFKAPTFNDLYWPGAGNPDLKPEESSTYELGLRGTNYGIHWRAALFQTEVENLIAWTPNANGMWQPSNVNLAEMEGGELELSSQFAGWNWSGSASILNAKDKNTEKRLPRRAQKTFRFDLDRDFGKYTFGASLYGQSHRYDDRNNETKLSGFALTDLRMDYRLSKDTLLQARVNNLFDREYETADGYASPEQEIRVGFRHQF